MSKQTAKLPAGKNKQTNKSKKTLLKTDTPTDVETANAKMFEDEREKQLKKTEKALEKRKTAIKRAKMELSEQTQQIAALKFFATQLEIKIKTAEEENRFLKIKLLAQTNTTYDEKKETYERSPTKTCDQDIVTTQLLTTIASLTPTVATLTLRIDSLAGKVDGKSREEGVRESQYPATSYEMPTLQDYNHHTRAERFEKRGREARNQREPVPCNKLRNAYPSGLQSSHKSRALRKRGREARNQREPVPCNKLRNAYPSGLQPPHKSRVLRNAHPSRSQPNKRRTHKSAA